MIATLGSISLTLALVCAVAGLVVLAAGRRPRQDPVRAAWGRLAAAGVFVCVTLAVVMMEAALIGFDFSIRYVALNVNRATPLLFRVAGLWGALEGSILLWAWVLTGLTLLVAVEYRSKHSDLIPHVLTVLLGIAVFFVGVMVGPANPFARLPVLPVDGRGLNPLLQNHLLMAIHPPLLYLGYVGFSIPYAFAMGTLLSGRPRDEWMTITRRWTLVAWTSLTAGLLLGARWSYDVLGWGGYWAWDPVENAAIMPWLVATAYLHSVMVEEKRRLLRSWNLSLVIATFALTILGTFLTRSGVVNSVHAFTQSAIGPLLLGYLVAIVVLSVGLLLWRLPTLRDTGAVGSPLSREAIFLFQNVVFVAATLTVLLGTLYPLIAEALSGAQLSIGRPYFDRVEVPLALALLFLMGIGPQLPWHGASRATLERQFTAPIVAAAGGALLAVATGLGGVLAVLTYALAAFVAATVVQEFARGIRARRAPPGESTAPAFAILIPRSGSRYGRYWQRSAMRP